MRSATRSRRSRPRPTCPSGRPSATRIEDGTGCGNGSKTATSREPPADPVRPGDDRVDHPAPAPLSARRRGPGARARPARARALPRSRGRLGVPGPLSGPAGEAGRADRRADRGGRRGRGPRRRGESGQDPVLRRNRRLPLQARRRAGRRPRPRVRVRTRARADRQGAGPRGRRGRGRRGGDAHRLRRERGPGSAVIGTGRSDVHVTITGLGAYVPERVVTNDELSRLADTSDEWIVERTGIRERRIAADSEALSDLALPAIDQALGQAGLAGKDVDLLIVATVTPDMMFPSTSAILADRLGAADAAAYDLSAGCTGFMYALAQAYGMVAAGLSQRALVVGGDVLSRILDWTDRSTVFLFGGGAGAVVLEPSDEPGFLAFELGADGAGGEHLWLPGSGSRLFDDPDRFVKMNGREVFKFATRVLVQSAEAVLDRTGTRIEDVDVYVPHQANVRIIDHATKKLGIPSDRVVINVDRYGNTSSGSIPLALAEAQADGRLERGQLVLMTGMGAGLTWGSALLRWTQGLEAPPAEPATPGRESRSPEATAG